ncbi:centrosomal protein of 135 kDa-like isoform X2 [Antedon mediterranea]|uniref:centrosomal protein of 135 kDa-like isoform X2 n=1 Tax=Antedon mediterranea TaxID=105859 RepID=UPI003AF7E096
MSTATERKFTNLRKRLDQLGYRQALGIETLPLVEKLFNDLIHTTESLKKSKLQASQVIHEKGTWEEQIEPYRSDNAKLVKENNDLHLQLIKVREDLDSTSKSLKSSIRKLEHENADLRFLNTQYVHKVRTVEKESKQKSDRIAQLQEKNFKAVVQTPGGRKKNIPFRRQRMDIDSTVLPSHDTRTPSVPAVLDPYVADLLQVADAKIEDLQREVEQLRELNESYEKAIRSLRKQVDTRDQEIGRLGRQLEGGRPYDVVSMEAKNKGNDRLVSHLNIQIDYLQEANRDLEKRLKEALLNREDAVTTVDELGLKNQELVAELQDIDRLTKRLQTDKDVAIAAADQDVSEAKVELRHTIHELESVELEMNQMRQERKNILADVEQLTREQQIKDAELNDLREMMHKVQEDKRKLSDRVNKLTSNERELVLELERLRTKGSKGRRDKSPTKMDSYIKTIEEERDYLKGEVDILNKLMKNKSVLSSPSNSPLRSRSSSPSKSAALKSSHLETTIKVLEDERDFYKKEYEIMKSIRTKSGSPSKIRTPPVREKNNFDETEIFRLRRERDELQTVLDKFERHLAEIQSNVKVLTADRDKTKLLYEQANDELQRLRIELVKSPKASRSSIAAQSILKRVEIERDTAISDSRRMTTERDSLRERLKIAIDGNVSEKARYEQKIEDLEIAYQKADQDRTSLQTRVNSMRNMINTLEDQVKAQSLRMEETNDEASQQRATATQMRLVAEHAEQTVGDHQRKLVQKHGELNEALTVRNRLEERVNDLNKNNAMLRDEINTLRMTIGKVDRDKDSLQMTVDEKTEKVVSFEREVDEKNKFLSELKMTIGDLEARLDKLNDDLSSRDREVRSLRRQLDGTKDELSNINHGRDEAVGDNRRLQDDLSTMTRENQAINVELEEAINERESVKAQIQDYISEVSRMEDLLAAKERENAELLNNYRAVSTEAHHWESEAAQQADETTNAKVELLTKQTELQRVADRIHMLELELQEQQKTQQAYEIQVSNLTKSLTNMEDELRQLQEEKQAVLQDLSAVRELCMKLDTTKESLSRQLTATNIQKEQIESALEDAKKEADLLRNQIMTEKSSSRNLEGLLQANREKEFQHQLESQEQRSELQILKDRLALSDSKIQSQSREIQNLRSRTTQMESESERFKRQLTSERFEKERIVQELRRSTLSPSPGSRPGDHSSTRRSMSPERSGLFSPVSNSISSPTQMRSPTRTRSPTRSRSPSRLKSPTYSRTSDWR